MQLTFLGACKEVGRSAILIESNDYHLLLDTGLKIHNHNEPPYAIERLRIDAVLLTHAHLDHSGALPILYKNTTPVTFCTPPTIPLTTLLLNDAEKVALKRGIRAPFTRHHITRALRNTFATLYNETYELTKGLSFSFHDAGHIPGSATAQITNKNKKILYTSDYKLVTTRMQKGAALPENINTLIIESTYALREQPQRTAVEKAFTESVRACIEGNEPALIPAFAVGRAQEILQVLYTHLPNCETYIDGMAREASQIIQGFPGYIHNHKTLQKALRHAHFVNPAQRKKLTKQGVAIITTAGMLDGGPVLNYILAMTKTKKGKILLVGYQVKGTNGHQLLQHHQIHLPAHHEAQPREPRERSERSERGKAKPRETREAQPRVRVLHVPLEVEFYNFSAHASRSELFQTIAKLNPERIFCIHGDAQECETFAQQLKEQGFNATAPNIGQRFEI